MNNIVDLDADLNAEANAIRAGRRDDQPATNALTATTTSPPADEPTWWSTTNAMTMCAVLLLFGVLVMALSTYLMKSGQSAQSILRVFGTLLVIIMAVFLVVAGYDDAQLGAPLGLLGTIAGYLLGRQSGEAPRAERGKEPEA